MEHELAERETRRLELHRLESQLLPGKRLSSLLKVRMTLYGHAVTQGRHRCFPVWSTLQAIAVILLLIGTKSKISPDTVRGTLSVIAKDS